MWGHEMGQGAISEGQQGDMWGCHVVVKGEMGGVGGQGGAQRAMKWDVGPSGGTTGGCGVVMGSLWGTQGPHGVSGGTEGNCGFMKWDVGSLRGMWGHEMGCGAIRKDNRGMWGCYGVVMGHPGLSWGR